jgi:hypothetical protein
MRRSPSIVPADRDVYLVLDDFWPGADEESTDRTAISRPIGGPLAFKAVRSPVFDSFSSEGANA